MDDVEKKLAEYGYKEIRVNGHMKRLFYSPSISSCGRTTNGVAFRFEGDGCWVIDLDDLRKLVAEADEIRLTTPQ